jgi:hypothetical protein
MTEHEWMACTNPRRLLENIGDRWSDRKLRLFACACLRLEPWGNDERVQSIIRTVERYVEKKATRDELYDARRFGDAVFPAPANDLLPGPPLWFVCSLATAGSAALILKFSSRCPVAEGLGVKHRRALCQFIRCIFGNPFHPLPEIPAAVLSWNDATVPRIARGIYSNRAFDDMPILADALLEGGCDDEGLLGHCRNGPHTRGCWAVDLILGKI